MSDQSYRAYVVVNPRSGGGFTGLRFARIAKHIREAIGEFDHGFTNSAGHATEMTREALREGYEMIVAVGGDGTFNEVVNGFFENGAPVNEDAVFAIIPRGTGGDLRKTLEVPNDLRLACAKLTGRSARWVDVGHMKFVSHDGSDAEKMFINITSFGVAGLVVDRVNKASKMFGGKVSFMMGSLKALLQYEDQTVTLTLDDGDPFTAPITAVAVCNGQYFGGGMWVAPGAKIDDGLFDVTTWKGLGLKDFALRSRTIYDGSHIEDSRTGSTRCKVLKAHSDEIVLLDMDGEQPGRLPAELRILPAALKLKC